MEELGKVFGEGHEASKCNKILLSYEGNKIFGKGVWVNHLIKINRTCGRDLRIPQHLFKLI